MIKEKSAGILIFRQKNSKREYLLLHYAGEKGNDYWDLPKGHVEKGETEEQTARRETQEETGITKLAIIPGFKDSMTYYFKKGKDLIFKEVVYFAAEVDAKTEVTISEEHVGFAWHDYESTQKTLNYKNAKELLQKVEEFLNKKQKASLTRFFE